MAMSECRECGKAVSTLAKTCPSCGVPKPAKTAKKNLAKSKSKSRTESRTKKLSNINYVWAHCKSSSCKDFSQMHQIPSTAVGKRICSACRGYLKKAKYVEGSPIMPVKKFEKKNPISQGIGDFRRGFNTTPEEINAMNAQTEKSTTTQTTSGKKDTFEKFLDGELDLATSFWGFLVAGTFIVGFVSGFLSEMIGSWVIIALAIYTWVAVAGTWASAEKYKIIQTKQNQSLVWGFLAQIMCVLNVISTIGLLFETFS